MLRKPLTDRFPVEDPARLWGPWFVERTKERQDAIATHYWPLVERIANARACRSQQTDHVADAGDVAQDLYPDLIQLINAYTPGRHLSFTAYATQILTRRAITALRGYAATTRGERARGVERVVWNAGGFTPDDVNDVDGWSEPVWDEASDRAAADEDAYAESIVMCFPLSMRSVVRQRFFEQRTVDEIADRHGKTVSWASINWRACLPDLLKRVGRPDLLEVADQMLFVRKQRPSVAADRPDVAGRITPPTADDQAEAIPLRRAA